MNIQRLNDVMASMLDCLCAAMASIAEAGGPEVCMCVMLPGESVPLDYCAESGCGGMAWVRLVRIGEDESLDTTSLRSCFVPMMAEVEMGVIRGYEFDGEIIPDEEDQLSMSIRQLDDAAAMSRAMSCCATEHEFRVANYTPSGPQGGCYGGVWTAQVPL